MSTSFVVPDDWSPEQRLARLEAIADAGAQSAEVQRLAALVNAQLDIATPRLAAVPAGDVRFLLALPLRLIQSRPFVSDPAGPDVYQDAATTWARGGDCEDLASALVALYRALGLRARLVWMPQPREAQAHVTAQVTTASVGVPSGQVEWIWAEPTVNARLGEYPLDAAARLNHWTPFRG